MQRKRARSSVDRAIAKLAAGRHGVFTSADLRAAGVGPTAISDRVHVGVLHRLHQGVYSTAPPHLLNVEAHWLAAVRACGPAAVLSHTAAAALWDLWSMPSGPVHVSDLSRNGRRRRDGIVLHRPTTLLPSQTTVRRAIPVTTPARTVRDLRRILSKRQIASVLRRAEHRRLDVGPQPEWVDDPSQSELERRFLALCRRHRLPPPMRQQIIGAYTVDFLWPEARLVVEADGYATHGPRAAFETDRARDLALRRIGYEVIRLTWRQIVHEGAAVATSLRSLLYP